MILNCGCSNTVQALTVLITRSSCSLLALNVLPILLNTSNSPTVSVSVTIILSDAIYPLQAIQLIDLLSAFTFKPYFLTEASLLCKYFNTQLISKLFLSPNTIWSNLINSLPYVLYSHTILILSDEIIF